MDESIREPGHLCELLIVSPSGIGRNRFKQCVRHPIVLAVITSNYGALGAEPGDDTAKRAGLIRERNLVVGAEARLERVVAEVHGLFLTRLVRCQKLPRDLVFASVRRYHQCAPGRLPRNVPLDHFAEVREADRVAEGELSGRRHAISHWVRSLRARR